MVLRVTWNQCSSFRGTVDLFVRHKKDVSISRVTRDSVSTSRIISVPEELEVES